MPLKLNFLIFLILSFLITGSLWAQDEEEIPNMPAHAKVIEPGEGENLEANLEKFREENQAMIKQLESLNPEQKEEFQKTVQSGNMLEASKMMEKFGIKAIDPTSGEGMGGMQSLVNLSLSQFRQMSPDQMLTQFQTKLDRTPFGKYFRESPRLQNATVKVFSDEEALPKFFSILNQKKELSIYFAVYVFTMIVAFIMRKKNKGVERPFFEAFMAWMMKFSFIWGIRLATFVFLFFPQVSPLGRVIWSAL